jgi:CRISPR system Cascade subunit CasA
VLLRNLVTTASSMYADRFPPVAAASRTFAHTLAESRMETVILSSLGRPIRFGFFAFLSIKASHRKLYGKIKKKVEYSSRKCKGSSVIGCLQNFMESMNLTSNLWVPVVYTSGQSGDVSLQELFARAGEIRDLAVRPYERVAVMRLLTCITHAALNGPANRKVWKSCRAEIAPAVASYLERYSGAFDLFGISPFLQVADLKLATDDEGLSVSTLDCALASGANPTLFDHAGGERREFNPLSLLAHQNFSTGGLIGVGRWGGQPTSGWTTYPRPSVGRSSHAPCLAGNMLHTYLIGATLLETIHLNVLNRELVAEALGDNRWGRPIWEQMPTSPLDKPAVQNATTTYLGRLVPLSRSILVRDDCKTLARANGLDYPDCS